MEDWQADVPAPYDGIRIIGARWSPDSYEVKDFLSRNQVPYRFFDVETDPDAKAIAAAGDHPATLPMVVFPDGTRLERPDNRMLADHAGLQTAPTTTHYDLVDRRCRSGGSGAGVYGASEGLRTALIERHATGGQAGTSSRIENYLGFPQGHQRRRPGPSGHVAGETPRRGDPDGGRG